MTCGEGAVCDPADGSCHCATVDGPACGEDGRVCAVDRCVHPLPAAICVDGAASWSPAGPSLFREATDAWGLRGVEGQRLSLADVDGDGRADLYVRVAAMRADVATPGRAAPEARAWLLRNRSVQGAAAGFDDITLESGILTSRVLGAGVGRPVSGAAFADVDNDGDVDVYLAVDTSNEEPSMGERSELLLNDGSGHFTLAPSGAHSPDWLSVPAGLSFVDYNGDGNVDLWYAENSVGGNPSPDILFRGDGAGGFVDVTASVGLMTERFTDFDAADAAQLHSNAWGSLARDLNGDGITELLVPSYGRAPNHLWQGVRAADGTVTFVNRSIESGYAFDQDTTWQDNQHALCFCQASPGADGCAGLGPSLLQCVDGWRHDVDRRAFRMGGVSSATGAGDIDGDGDLDLMTSEIRHWWAGSGADGSELLLNDGTATFDRPGDAALGLAVDHTTVDWDEGHLTNALFDFDNDGRLDIYIGATDYAGNRGRLYHQRADMLAFEELTTEQFFEHNRSHGVVTTDVDGDGDLDILVGHSRARCDATRPNDCYATAQVRAFENLSPPGNWLAVRLEGGEGTNRMAIGAQVTVTTADGRTQVAEVDGGHGHYGTQSDPLLHFGLGTHCDAQVRVRWPNQNLPIEESTLPAGHAFAWREGDSPRAL